MLRKKSFWVVRVVKINGRDVKEPIKGFVLESAARRYAEAIKKRAKKAGLGGRYVVQR